MTRSSDLVGVHRDGPVLCVTLQREDAMNARSIDVRRSVIAAIDEADRDSSVRAVVLAGSGRAFSVGLDLGEAAKRADLPLAEAVDARHEANDVARVGAAQKPTIAAINGFALGGGLELALACDIRIAADDAKLGFPEVSRGTLPGNGGTQRLPRIVGIASAMEIILTGEMITAQDAASRGLVNRVVPRDRLLSEAMGLAHRIAENGPLAVRLAKQAIRSAMDTPLQSGLEYEGSLSLLTLFTEDRREGIQAFKEKRKPNWTGR